MGIYKSIDDAVKAVVLTDQATPDKLYHKMYVKYFKIFERLTSKLANEFAKYCQLTASVRKLLYKNDLRNKYA